MQGPRLKSRCGATLGRGADAAPILQLVSVRLEASLRAARAVGRALPRERAAAAARRCRARVLDGLAPRGVEQLAAALPLGSAAVSATNGKTTTCAMVASILDPPIRLCRNAAGANLLSGIAAALVDGAGGGSACRARAVRVRRGRAAEDRARASGRTPSRSATSSATSSTATASSRRSPSAGATMLAELPAETTVVACADDPLTADITSGHARCVSYGIDDPELARGPLAHAADSRFCVRCGTPYDYAAVWFGHLGDYRCPSCGHARPGARDLGREDRAARARGGHLRAADAGRHVRGRARRARALQRRERARRERRRARPRCLAR